MSLIEVSHDYPIPPKKQGKRTDVYPWDTMAVGGSFDFGAVLPETAWTAAWRAGRKYAPKKFIARKHNGTMRCWRVA